MYGYTDHVMVPIEANTHSFVVRVWREETTEPGDHVIWRGHITHVSTHQKRYLQDLEEIIFFMLPYLQQMGVEVSWTWRIWQWWHRQWHKQRV